MDAVRVRFEKWGRRPHWEYDALRLGTDDHGTWVGLPPGTPVSRPGRSFVTGQPQVVLAPHAAPFVATFYAREEEFAAHQHELGYPDDLVALAIRSCAQVRAAVESASPPYDAATARGWLAELETAMMRP